MISFGPRQLIATPVAVALLLQVAGGLNAALADTATEIIKATGVQGGVIVHLGCGDGKLTAALRVNGRYQVQGLARDPAEVSEDVRLGRYSAECARNLWGWEG